MNRIKLVIALSLAVGLAYHVQAQGQLIGFYESDYVLKQIPEYTGIQQQLDLLSNQWQEEIRRQEEEIEELEEDYKAKEILYTEEIRNQKRQEINEMKRAKERYLSQKFGPEGEYFARQRELLEPIQRQVFAAVREVASRQGFDFVFDRSGDIYMVFANNEYNLTQDILIELGIETDQ